MSRVTERIKRDLSEIARRATPSPDAWVQIRQRIERAGDEQEMEVVMIETDEQQSTGGRRPLALAAAAAAIVVGLIAAAMVLDLGGDDDVRVAGRPEPSGGDEGDAPPDGPDSSDIPTAVTVSVDGTAYVLAEPDLCFYESTGPATGRPLLHVIGTTGDGSRVELHLHHDAEPVDPAIAPGYTGRLSVQTDGAARTWRAPSSAEPWPTLTIESTGVTGEISMADRDGQSVEVAVSVSCGT